METRYPIRKAEGKDFSGPDEIVSLLRREKHGQWLAGNNGMWHGGIHISRESAPQAVISAGSPDGAMPLQCIADGEIVAWRIQKDYHQQPWGEDEENKLHYSSSFLLVRSVHKPDENPATWLTFHTLYMHLAPLSCFPERLVYEVTEQGNGLSKRRYSGREVHNQLAPETTGTLRSGERVSVDRQEIFLLRPKERYKNGRELSDISSPFGLAQKLKDGVPQGEKFWTSVLPEYLAPLSEQYSHLPEWMSKAVEKGTFDSVVLPEQPIAIRAGDAVGFLARDDAPAKNGTVSTDWFMHIEVISNDKNMPAFLDNPGQLTKGTLYIEVLENQPLYQCEEVGEKRVFTPMDVMATADNGKIMARDKAKPAQDETGETWYQIRPHSWVNQKSVKEIIQHDLTALKFVSLEQEPAKDTSQSLSEAWIRRAFNWLSGTIQPERDLESQEQSEYYAQLAGVLDANKDGKISAVEMDMYRHSVLYGLRNRSKEVEMLLRRLIVKHESEWFGKSSHPRWAKMLTDLSPDAKKYAEKWLDDHEWMSQVPAFNKDEAIWHFHPVEFLQTIKQNELYIITVELIEKLLGHTNPWFTGKRGGKTFAPKFQERYPDVFQYDKTDFVNKLNEIMSEFGISGPYHKAHFLAQCLHESAHFDTTLEFGSGKNYEPGVHSDAYVNENRSIGDGPRYRGRGLIQLTWKRNYRLYFEFSGTDIISNPEKVAEDMDTAIRTSCWFWRNNGGVTVKYNARGDINTLIDNEPNNVRLVSRAVNGGINGLSERISCFAEIKSEWGLE